MKLSDLKEGQKGKLRKKPFKVIYRCPEDRSSGFTDIQFKDNSILRYIWDKHDPSVTKL